MTDPNFVKQLVNQYKGDTRLDGGSFAANTANTSEPEAERWKLVLQTQQNWENIGSGYGQPPVSDFEAEHGLGREFAVAMGHKRQPADPGNVGQQGGRLVIDGSLPDGHPRAVRRSSLAQPATVNRTVNLAKTAPPLTLAQELDLERRNLLASGILTGHERLMLEDDRTPAEKMVEGW